MKSENNGLIMDITGQNKSKDMELEQSTTNVQETSNYLITRREIEGTPFEIIETETNTALVYKQHAIIVRSNPAEVLKWYENNKITAIITAAAITMEIVKNSKE